MNLIGRIIIRPETNKSALILGVAFKKNELLKPNIIYELQELDGEIILKEIGHPAMDKNQWSRTANDIIENGIHLVTTEELNNLYPENND